MAAFHKEVWMRKTSLQLFFSVVITEPFHKCKYEWLSSDEAFITALLGVFWSCVNALKSRWCYKRCRKSIYCIYIAWNLMDFKWKIPAIIFVSQKRTAMKSKTKDVFNQQREFCQSSVLWSKFNVKIGLFFLWSQLVSAFNFLVDGLCRVKVKMQSKSSVSAGSLWKLLEGPYMLEMNFDSDIHIMKFCFFSCSIQLGLTAEF